MSWHTKNMLRVTCRDCGKYRMALRKEFTRAAGVRCLHCGGAVDVSHSGQQVMAVSRDAKNEQKLRQRRSQ